MQRRYHPICRAVRIKTKLTFCRQTSSRYCNWDVPQWSDLICSDRLHFVFKHHTLMWKSVALSFWLDSLKKILLQTVLSWRLFLCWACTLPRFLPVPTDYDCSLEGQDTLTASLYCLWFYSWKSKFFIHHQEAFIKQHIKKEKRVERRCIWGWVTAPDTTGSHSFFPQDSTVLLMADCIKF